jgi:NitT/TauT family transport system substrate-binding protein
MCDQHAEGWTRQAFLGGLTLAGTAGVLRLHTRPVAAEPPPETTVLRLGWSGGVCQAPQYVAEELLYGEGFTDVRYIPRSGSLVERLNALASGEVHSAATFIGPILQRLDAGDTITVLEGVPGEWQLFAAD